MNSVRDVVEKMPRRFVNYDRFRERAAAMTAPEVIERFIRVKRAGDAIRERVEAGMGTETDRAMLDLADHECEALLILRLDAWDDEHPDHWKGYA